MAYYCTNINSLEFDGGAVIKVDVEAVDYH